MIIRTGAVLFSLLALASIPGLLDVWHSLIVSPSAGRVGECVPYTLATVVFTILAVKLFTLPTTPPSEPP